MNNAIVIDGITYYRELPESYTYDEAVAKWNWLVAGVRREAERAQAVYDAHREDGLSVSMIQSEGYLRCIKSMLNRIEHVENTIEKVEL